MDTICPSALPYQGQITFFFNATETHGRPEVIRSAVFASFELERYACAITAGTRILLPIMLLGVHLDYRAYESGNKLIAETCFEFGHHIEACAMVRGN